MATRYCKAHRHLRQFPAGAVSFSCAGCGQHVCLPCRSGRPMVARASPKQFTIHNTELLPTPPGFVGDDAHIVPDALSCLPLRGEGGRAKRGRMRWNRYGQMKTVDRIENSVSTSSVTAFAATASPQGEAFTASSFFMRAPPENASCLRAADRRPYGIAAACISETMHNS